MAKYGNICSSVQHKNALREMVEIGGRLNIVALRLYSIVLLLYFFLLAVKYTLSVNAASSLSGITAWHF